LGDAVDANSLSWTTGGDANWFRQTATMHDGVDAACSGDIGDSQQSWVETTVTGPGTLYFWWRVSSESACDYLKFLYDGYEQTGIISGESGWQQPSWNIPAGTHSVRWVYTKDGSVSSGSDCGWLDQVVWSPTLQSSTTTYNPVTTTYRSSSTTTYNPVTTTYRSSTTTYAQNSTTTYRSSTTTYAQNSTTTYISPVTTTYRSSTTTYVSGTLGDAVDANSLSWTTGGDANWFRQTATMHDGVDAACSGDISDSQQSWMETTVTGPGSLSYWWRVSSESGFDYLKFFYDGYEQAGSISGESNWLYKAWAIPAGTHNVRWAYAKDSSASTGSDSGWLDQVVWVPSANSGSLQFNQVSYPAFEGTKQKVFVSRINGSDGVVSVNYLTKPKTAIAWQDYIPKSGTLTWLNGDSTAKVIKINILADGKVEGNEVFKVVLTNPVGATLATPLTAAISIQANSKSVQLANDATAIRMTRLTDALDGVGLTWFTSEQTPWTKQSFVTVDGVDAAISGGSSIDQTSWLQTDLEGAGKLEFDWLVKGSGKDPCLVFVNGKVRRTLAPGYDWSHETLTLGEGDHTVRWVFVGDTGLTPGAAYLDQVKWVPNE
jgi:hypothetical protein